MQRSDQFRERDRHDLHSHAQSGHRLQHLLPLIASDGFLRGAKNVLLTLGGAGAYFSNGERLWFARRAFEVKVRSTVCAGDSSLAAFLSIWSSERDRVEDALRRSMATGANVVECAGLGDFARVGEYEKGIEVRLVK